MLFSLSMFSIPSLPYSIYIFFSWTGGGLWDSSLTMKEWCGRLAFKSSWGVCLYCDSSYYYSRLPCSESLMYPSEGALEFERTTIVLDLFYLFFLTLGAWMDRFLDFLLLRLYYLLAAYISLIISLYISKSSPSSPLSSSSSSSPIATSNILFWISALDEKLPLHFKETSSLQFGFYLNRSYVASTNL